MQGKTDLFLPEEMRAGADSPALVCLLQQLGAVPSSLVHQHVSVLWGEDSALVQSAHNALQRCDLCFAVWYGFFVQYECLQIAAGSGERIAMWWTAVHTMQLDSAYRACNFQAQGVLNRAVPKAFC